MDIQLKRIERLEKLQSKMMSTVEDSMKRNMEFKSELIKRVEQLRKDQKNVLKKLRGMEEKLEHMNALTQELVKSVGSLEKDKMLIENRVLRLERPKK